MSQLVQEFLRAKDEDYSKYIPPLYNIPEDQKHESLIVRTETSKYEIRAAAKCVKPCFKNLNTGMVAESESECMTNCVAKSFQVLASLQLYYAQKA